MRRQRNLLQMKEKEKKKLKKQWIKQKKNLSDKEFKPLETRMLTKYGEVKDEQNKNFE